MGQDISFVGMVVGVSVTGNVGVSEIFATKAGVLVPDGIAAGVKFEFGEQAVRANTKSRMRKDFIKRTFLVDSSPNPAFRSRGDGI